MEYSLGIDLSGWDPKPLDWKLASGFLDFAFIKGSEGLVEDRLFRIHWRAAKGKILRGAYHYFRNYIDPALAASRFAELLEPDPGEIPPALDLETTDGLPNTLQRARAWLERYEMITGVRPIVYSNIAFLQSIGADRSFLGIYLERWLLKYEFWIAQYYGDLLSEPVRSDWIDSVLTGERKIGFPKPPGPWKGSPLFWQWTSRGDPSRLPGYYTGPGAKKAIDYNFFRGKSEELRARFGPVAEGEEDPDPGPRYPFRISPLSSASNIRSSHYVESKPSNVIGRLPFGRSAYGVERWIAQENGSGYLAGDTWIRIVESAGEPLEGWIASIHNGRKIAKIEELEWKR